jgi:hypothetical protein
MSLFRAGDKTSVSALILANLVPLGAVCFLGWTVSSVVLLYWWENVVIGWYTFLKIIVLTIKKRENRVDNAVAIPFFFIHYGLFCLGHAMVILAIFPNDGILLSGEETVRIFAWRLPGFVLPVLALFVSHGISFVENYLGKKEYEEVGLGSLMGSPYPRILVLHIAIVAAAFVILLVGSPVPLLVALVVAKIWMDIRLHNREHWWLRENDEGYPEI